MTYRPFAGALLLVIAPVAAQEPSTPADAPVHMPAAPESMPFDLQDNLVRVEARVNGQSQSAVLDSGTGALMTDRRMVDKLGLKETLSSEEAAGAGSGAQQLRTVNLADVSIGPIQFRNVEGYTGDLSHLSSSAQFPIDLLVGAPAFKYGAVTVDYPGRRVTFGPSGSAATCAAPIPLELVHGVPVVEIELKQTPDSAPVRLKMMVDLGTRQFAAFVGGPFLRSEAGIALMRSGAARQVGTGIGGKVQGTVARVAELRIGQSGFGAHDIALSSGVKAMELGLFDGTLGVPLWKAGVITFDYPAHRLCIDIPKQG
jgi:hypothetical protein